MIIPLGWAFRFLYNSCVILCSIGVERTKCKLGWGVFFPFLFLSLSFSCSHLVRKFPKLGDTYRLAPKLLTINLQQTTSGFCVERSSQQEAFSTATTLMTSQTRQGVSGRYGRAGKGGGGDSHKVRGMGKMKRKEK